VIRRAHPTDAGAVGAILSQFIDLTDWMPRLYSRAQELGFAGTMIDRGWVTVIEPEGEGQGIAGFLAMDNGFIHALYIARDWRGQGLGQSLLDDAKTLSSRLELRTFQHNHAAQRFYVRAGFQEVGRGDGADNDEGLPDVQMVWERNAA